MKIFTFLIVGITLFCNFQGFANQEDSTLTPLPRFDWSKYLEVPPRSSDSEFQRPGFQILHFNTQNRPYIQNEKATAFVQTYLQQAKKLYSDSQVLLEGSLSVTVEGFFIEAGSCTGRTTNFIAALNPEKTIYGFDCFEGLPEDWIRGDKVFEKGTFSLKDQENLFLPVLDNVTLYKGLFKDVLPLFKEEILKTSPVSFLHIDSDTYSACKDVLDLLHSHFVPGTIIVFDELYNYPGAEEHEWKALTEFIETSDFDIEFIAFNAYHEQVAIRLIPRLEHP